MTLKAFELKLFSHFQDAVKLYFPKEILKICETPLDLIEYVSKVKETLKLEETFRGKVSDRNEYHLLNNPNLYRRSTPGYIYLYNFIMNRVPSDLYRVKNPKLEIDRAAASNNSEFYSVIKQVAPDAAMDDKEED